MTTTVAIPARLASTRLPGKVLLELGGKSIVQHVWERARQARGVGEVVILTDTEEVRQAAESWGARVLMTAPECPSGTARIVSRLNDLEGDLIVNVQGDEPFIKPTIIETLIESYQATKAEMITAVFKIDSDERLRDPNLVKCVRAYDGRALYFSRSPVPYLRDLNRTENTQPTWTAQADYWGHVGIYAYSRSLLERYPTLNDSPLERAESLEQLRILENGYRIQTVITEDEPIAIDTPEDLARARNLVSQTTHE